jgi:hypothetical protein
LSDVGPERRDNRDNEVVMTTRQNDHICAAHAICFQCFRAGVERTRARREAWAQRSLPFESPGTDLTPREIAHRQQMLAHLARKARRA